ncbi:MAG: zinc ribbon domain-containing protein [Thermoplasmata archaeon]
MGFQESFEKFKKSKLVVPTYIVLVILICMGLVYLNTCLATILIPVAMFAIPFYMGEKRFRYFILLGIIVVLVNSVALGLLNADYIRGYQTPEQMSADEHTITQGTITPTVGGADTQFNFTVWITSNVTDVNLVQVWVNISELQEYKPHSDEYHPMNASDSLDTNLSDGKEYHVTIQLPKGVHFFHFAADIDGTWYTTLFYDELSSAYLKALGPINADFPTVFWMYFQAALMYMFFTSILFMIFVMAYWWIGKSRIERAKWDDRLRQAGELEPVEAEIPEFECTNCGRPVHEDALRCPHCGAIFEEEETEPEPVE